MHMILLQVGKIELLQEVHVMSDNEPKNKNLIEILKDFQEQSEKNEKWKDSLTAYNITAMPDMEFRSDADDIIKYLESKQPSKRQRFLTKFERISLWIIAVAGFIIALLTFFLTVF